MQRTLGRSRIEVSALGLGCWAIGGPFFLNGQPDGWGAVDDAESIRAIHSALDLGVTLLDTSDAYGTGHSETIIGQALRGRRDQVAIATKFGFTHDAERRELTGVDVSPAAIRRACEASLRRLQTDYIDLYQLHVGELSAEEAVSTAHTLDQLHQEGTIRAYGWSVGDAARADHFAARTQCVAIQHQMNVLYDDGAMLDVCARYGTASIVNSPLAMGLLSGKFNRDARLPTDDVRGGGQPWVAYFTDGKPDPRLLDMVASVRDVLTSDGRTLVQGALAWIWARSPLTIPIPGFKNVRQAEENARALAYGPLTPEQMGQIDVILERHAVMEAPGG